MKKKLKLKPRKTLLFVVFLNLCFLWGTDHAMAGNEKTRLVAVMQQEITVTGNISDNNGEPLPGVTILLKGSTRGVISDIDGKYSIKVYTDTSTLVFSFIGMKTQEVNLAGRTVVNVEMEEDLIGLEEVVVIGYGSKKKTQLASSVSQVTGIEIKQSRVANFATSLAGRLPGLVVNQRSSDPGQEEVEILVRGKGTFGDNSTLIVIDGVVDRDGLSRLDPEDIASVSVLKDASASVYGARAANGVILVTTKRGVVGRPVVSITSNTSLSKPTTLPIGATPYNYARQVNAIRQRTGQSALYTEQDLNNFKSGSLKGIDFWQELFDKQSVQQRQNISVRGGTENAKYFASLGSTNQNAIVNFDDVSDFSQYNVRSNIDVKPVRNLNVGIDLAGRLENVDTPPYMFQTVDNTSKIIPLNQKYSVDGKFIRLLNNQNNPFSYISRESGKVESKNTLFNGTLRVDYDLPFLRGVSVGAWAAVDYAQNYTNSFNNNPVQYIQETDESLTPNQLGLDVMVQDAYFRQSSLTYNTNIAYKNSFGLHNVDAFVAFEQNQTVNNSNALSRRNGLISADLPYLSQGDPTTQLTMSNRNELARQAYITRIFYDFDEKYLASFGFRYDGSYIFPKGKRFGFFPFVSAGWVLSREEFLTDVEPLNFLKIRGTWGITGNDRVAPFQYLQRFENPPQGGGILYLSPDGTNNSAIPLEGTDLVILSPVGVDPNKDITWETSTSWDLGIEMRLFSSKLSIEADYFSEQRKDILAPRNVTIPAYTGLRPPFENIGETKNSGVEVSAAYQATLGEIHLNIGGNFSHSQNKLVFNDAPEPEETYQDLQGHPIGSKLVYHAIGIYRSQSDLDRYPHRPGTEIGDLIYTDANDDGEITTADMIVMDKSLTPTTQYGILLGANYKNFELSSFWQGQSGSVLQIASFLDENVSSANYFAENAWTPETPDAKLPAIGGTKTILNGYTSYDNDFFTYNTSFLRLKNIQLAYNIPASVLKKIGIESCRIHIGGSNLITFSSFNKLKFSDVEQTVGLGYNRPLRKLYDIGFEISF